MPTASNSPNIAVVAPISASDSSGRTESGENEEQDGDGGDASEHVC